MEFDAAQHGVSVLQGGIASRRACGGGRHSGGIAIEDPQVRMYWLCASMCY